MFAPDAGAAPGISPVIPTSGRVALEKLTELVDGQPSLAQDRGQRATSKLPMEGNDHRPTCLAAELDMTALLADLSEPCPLQSTDHLASRDDRKRGTHAGMSTGAMIGGSIPSGNG